LRAAHYGDIRLVREKDQTMKYGVVMRTDVALQTIADLAHGAEATGWDGFFI
jgi:hypothetical protein